MPLALSDGDRSERGGGPGGWLADFDLIVLFVLIMADVRVFQGSEVASFTLVELFIWGYCAPVVYVRLVVGRERLPTDCCAFMRVLTSYLLWLLAVSVFWLVYKADASVLQDAKNILPVAVLVLFVFVRVRARSTISRLCNLYVVYAVAACCVGLLQYKFGAPYVRPLIAGTEYKTSLEGEVILSPVVGFSGHPNEFAMAILPAVVFAGITLMAEIGDRRRVRLGTLLIMAVLGAGMVLSQARGAMAFSAAAGLFMLTPLERSRRFLPKFIWTSVLILVLVRYGLHQAAVGEAEGSGTVEVRYLLWQTSLAAMASDIAILLFGDGMHYVLYWSPQVAGWEFPDAHNAWIDQMLFFGTPAIVLYLLIWRQFFHTVEFTRLPPPTRWLQDGLRAAVLALMGDYFFEPVAHAVFPLMQLFWLMALGVRLVSLPTVRDSSVQPPGGAAAAITCSAHTPPMTIHPRAQSVGETPR
jgi:hypothetical protein